MHGHMSRYTVTCHDAQSHECKKLRFLRLRSEHSVIIFFCIWGLWERTRKVDLTYVRAYVIRRGGGCLYSLS
jgi:hypothetical protein